MPSLLFGGTTKSGRQTMILSISPKAKGRIGIYRFGLNFCANIRRTGKDLLSDIHNRMP
jgi:hypothetical protein